MTPCSSGWPVPYGRRTVVVIEVTITTNGCKRLEEFGVRDKEIREHRARGQNAAGAKEDHVDKAEFLAVSGFKSILDYSTYHLEGR